MTGIESCWEKGVRKGGREGGGRGEGEGPRTKFPRSSWVAIPASYHNPNFDQLSRETETEGREKGEGERQTCSDFPKLNLL